MKFRLEKRPEPSTTMLYLTPVLAVLLTMILGAIIFSFMGFNGLGAVKEIFFTPIINPLKWQDLAVKATPLVIISVGLAIGYRANVWNIGAEGQYIVGGLAATGVALATYELTGWWILPAMAIAGALGGMAWVAVPAYLRVKLKVNEILTTLMLVYVAVQLLNFLVFGPWKSPRSFGQPQTIAFSADQTLPYIVPGTIIQLGAPIAIVVALVAWLFMGKSLFGFQVRTVGSAPQAARHAGFSENKTIWLVLLISGGLAGFAGMLEVAGPFGRMVPQFPTNYGFTAIIVAFLGRLNPLGCLVAGIVLAITFVGGEVAQTTIQLPFPAVGIFQSMMLFLLLAGDILVRYRIKSIAPKSAAEVTETSV